jgi:hypothetical protein
MSYQSYQQLPPNDPRRQAFEAGLATGQRSQQFQADSQLQRALADLRADFDQRLNHVASGLRRQAAADVGRQVEQRLEQADRRLSDLAKVAEHLSTAKTGGISGDVLRIEDIPGTRVPWTMVVEIPIGHDVTSIQEESKTITQDGPFVATRRMATFLSSYEVQYTDPTSGTVMRFPGRSNGRFRPVSSASDLLDAKSWTSDVGAWFNTANANGAAGDNLPGAVLAQASSASSFRSMMFDGYIEVIEQGSGYPRQNGPVPSTWWSQGIQSPFDLSALDFFERGTAITWRVQPTHVNNPAFGNVTGDIIFPVAAALGAVGYPFLDGQFDPHEGVATANPALRGATANDVTPIEVDPYVRLPDGILYLAYEGYRIVQTRGPVR